MEAAQTDIHNKPWISTTAQDGADRTLGYGMSADNPLRTGYMVPKVSNWKYSETDAKSLATD